MFCGYLSNQRQPEVEAQLRDFGAFDELRLEQPGACFWLARSGPSRLWSAPEPGVISCIGLQGDMLLADPERPLPTNLDEKDLPALTKLAPRELGLRLAGSTSFCQLRQTPDGLELALAPERLGDGGIFYIEGEKGLLFSTDLRPLLAARGFELDLAGLTSFLVYGFVQAPFSLAKGINAVPPGLVRTFSWPSLAAREEAIQPWSYTEESDQFSFAESKRLAEESTLGLEASMQALCAERPALMFSAGVDSTALAVALTRGDYKPVALTLVREEGNELHRKTAEVAAQLGMQHLIVTSPAGQLASLLERVPQGLEQPCGDGAMITTQPLVDFARAELGKGAVLVDGSGAGGHFGEGRFRRRNRHRAAWKLHRLPVSPIKLLYRALYLNAGVEAADRVLGGMLKFHAPSSWQSAARNSGLVEFLELPKGTLAEVDALTEAHIRQICDRFGAERSTQRVHFVTNRAGPIYQRRTTLLAQEAGMHLTSPFLYPAVAHWVRRVPVPWLSSPKTYKYPIWHYIERALPDYEPAKGNFPWNLDYWLRQPGVAGVFWEHLARPEGQLAEIFPWRLMRRLLALSKRGVEVGGENHRFLFGCYTMARWLEDRAAAPHIEASWR